MKKLNKNQRGVSHHLLLPVLAIIAIVGIGLYLLKGSHAASLDSFSSATPLPVLIDSYDSSLQHTRYFKVNSDGSGLTELKNTNGKPIDYSDEGGLHSSYYFSKLIGSVAISRVIGARIYDVATKATTDLALNATPTNSVGSLRYSSNGAHLVYTLSRQSDSSPVNDIYTANPDGTNIHLVRSGGSSLYFINPSWQPGGFNIAYVENGTNLHIINVNGKPDINLGSVRSYAWSPNGQAIAYTDQNSKVHVVSTNGQNDKAFSSAVAGDLDFSPDSASLVFYNLTNKSLSKLNITTGAIKAVTSVPSVSSTVRWLRNGQVVYQDCGATAYNCVIKSITPDGTNKKTIFQPWGSMQTSFLETH